MDLSRLGQGGLEDSAEERVYSASVKPWLVLE